MTKPRRDPLELLAARQAPEPDDAVMRATIEASREEFARQMREAQARRGWFSRLRHGLGGSRAWLLPAGVAAAAALIAIAVLPGVLDDGPPPPGTRQVAETPEAPSLPKAVPRGDGGIRFGAQPVPQGGSLDPADLPPVDLSSLEIFEAEGLRLGLGREKDSYRLYLLVDSAALPLDEFRSAAGQQVEVIDAFRYPRPRGQPEVISVQLRGMQGSVDREAGDQRWVAYLLDHTGARLDPVLSEALADSTDRQEAERRLASALQPR